MLRFRPGQQEQWSHHSGRRGRWCLDQNWKGERLGVCLGNVTLEMTSEEFGFLCESGVQAALAEQY